MKLQLGCLAASLTACLVLCQAATPDDNLRVRTQTGVFTGLVNEQYSNVREFRTIPFAQPPIGSRRWLPPQPLGPSGQHFYSYRWPSVCPQFARKNESLWSNNITDFSPMTYGQSLLAGTMMQSSSEDCLYLAIWTPRNVSADSKLPVAIFIPGGSFINGGVSINYQVPASFISTHNDVIVVSMNYRLNIFGFPKAAGLEDQNLGMLDNRAAVEWIYNNIGAFGGDQERMILWGHSAGAVAVDIYNYAYYDSPLIKGLFLMSGTAAVPPPPEDPKFSNFTFVAKAVGCDFPDDPAAELGCMRQVPAGLLTNILGDYAANGTKPRLNFQGVKDDKVYYGNYTTRAAKGLLAKIPAIISTTANEQSSLAEYPLRNLTDGPWQEAVTNGTINTFVCPALNTTAWRSRHGLNTYRYQFAGTISALTPLAWMGEFLLSTAIVFRHTYPAASRRLPRRRRTYGHGLVP